MARITPREFVTKRGERVIIRSSEESDAPGVLEIYDDVRRTADDTTVTTTDEADPNLDRTRAEIRERLAHISKLQIVAASGERIVGELEFRPGNRRRLSHRGTLGICVHSGWRDQGIGRAMLEALIDWARGHPEIERLDLGVFAHNQRAIALYTKLGFVEVARRHKDFKIAPGRYFDDVQMELWVKPPSMASD